MLVRSHTRFEVRETFRLGHIGHWDLVGESFFGSMETGLQVEDGLPVLNGDNAAGREAFAVADAVDVVQDGGSRVAWTQEVCVQ